MTYSLLTIVLTCVEHCIGYLQTFDLFSKHSNQIPHMHLQKRFYAIPKLNLLSRAVAWQNRFQIYVSEAVCWPGSSRNKNRLRAYSALPLTNSRWTSSYMWIVESQKRILSSNVREKPALECCLIESTLSWHIIVLAQLKSSMCYL